MAHFCRLLLVIAFGLCELLASVSSQRVKPGLPLVSETPRPTRRPKKATDCQFGRTQYELEDVWHPDLGPPFGIMYCIQCECQPVRRMHRRRRIVGKVKCRNIKNDCVEPKCDDPVLLSGKCCKTCPQDLQNTMSFDGVHVSSVMFHYDEGHEYASLMTSDPTAQLTHIPTLASGRFVLHKRNLHYSIQYVGPEQPSLVVLSDEKGDIIEEQEAHVTHLYNSTYRVCGVWSKVPKSYRKHLREGGVYARLTSESFPDGIVAGQVVKISAVKSETFSALLIPSGTTGDSDFARRGGIAIISTASANSAAHFLLIFHNLLTEDWNNDIVNVRLESLQKDEDGSLIEETFILAGKLKPMQNNAAAEFKMNFDFRVFRQMARGKLMLSVAPRNSPNIRLSGIISPKVSCNVYHAVLSANLDNADDIVPLKPGAGQAVMLLADDGSIAFRIQVEGLQSPVTYIGLDVQNKKGMRSVHNLTAQYQDGWANGTLHRSSARDIELLMSEEFYVNVQTVKYENHLRGVVKQRLYGDAHSGEFPLLLRGSNTGAAGQAWMSVDESCRLYYEVVVSGMGYKKNNRRDVEEIGLVELVDGNSPYGPLSGHIDREVQLKQEFSGTEVEDMMDLEKVDVVSLGSGNAVLHVSINTTSSGNTSQMDLLARISNLRVPSSCLPDEIPNDETPQNAQFRCYHDGRWVDDGSQWTSSHNVCDMCSCQRGKVVCHSMVCPTLPCSNTHTLPGDCCPSCSVTNSSSTDIDNKTNKVCYFEGDKRFHRAGTTWHPYVPPFGFIRCAVCTCNATTLTVNCTRITCQPLSCAEKDAYREHHMACCKVCPRVEVEENEGQGDQGQQKSSEEEISYGGCRFRNEVVPNGKEWHPRVQPFGEMQCITCTCKDTKVNCSRPKCPSLSCQNKIVSEKECCPKCAESSSSHRSGSSKSTRRHREKLGA